MSSKLRILVISNLYPPYILGGYEVLCGQVTAQYVKRGHEVVVLTSDHGVSHGSSLKSEQLDGCLVYRSLKLYIPFSHSASLMRLRRLKTSWHNSKQTRELLNQWRPDVVHVWSQLRLTLGAAEECQRAGLPIAFSFNDEHISGYMPQTFGWAPKQMARWFLDNIALKQLTLAGMPLVHATAISQLTRQRIKDAGVKPAYFSVVYQGIDLAQFTPKANPGELSSPVNLLYVGQLLHYKGVHTVVQAVHQLIARGFDASLTVVGEGDAGYTKELHCLANRGPAYVKFFGKISRSDVPAVYREHNALIFASTFDAFGLTHLEAMASGLPVLSTLDGGQREFLVHEKNCLVFVAEDPESLASQLARLITSPALAEKLARAGLDTVRTAFSLDRYVDELLEFLEEARR